MKAANILADLRWRRVQVRAEGGDLHARAPRGVITAAVVHRLRQHKTEILAFLASADEWRAFYDERAGIAEHEGGMPRARAERMAWEACLSRWENSNPPTPLDPNMCAACDRPADIGGLRVLVLADGATVHDQCQDAWRQRRREMAVTAMVEFGIDGG